jgi:signal transduction histidine kinase
MRSVAELRRWWARSDVHLALALCGAISALLLALLGVLFFVASHEAAEVIENALEHELADAAAELATPDRPDRFARSPHRSALRSVDAAGRSRVLYGSWPRRGRLYGDDTSSVRLALASRRDHWMEELRLPGGGFLQGALPLEEFVEERREQLGQLALTFAIGLVGVLGVAAYATRRSLAPLRSATHALERIDERHLGERIPWRGTGDDVDRHAAALNRVLGRLEASFARMAAFSADVAHELRTPVNRILNLSDVALLDAEAEAAAPSLEAIRAAADEMGRMIDDMLLLARGEEGRLAVRPQRLAVAEVVGDLAELYRPSCEEREVVLSVLEREDAGKLATDPHLLQRAVSNLLDNAVRHAPRGGRIEIELRREGDEAHIAVSDSGPGVPEPERERIFDRFVQLDPARSQGGAGLGLPIARMIARLLGGDLVVRGSALGGACFELILRSLQNPGPGAARAAAEGAT